MRQFFVSFSFYFSNIYRQKYITYNRIKKKLHKKILNRRKTKCLILDLKSILNNRNSANSRSIKVKQEDLFLYNNYKESFNKSK